MKFKKTLMITALIAVILTVILTAGCTSTSEIKSDDPILGTWGNLNTEGEISTNATTFFENGLGNEKILFLNGETDDFIFTWKKVGDATYHISYGDGEVYEATIVDDNTQLLWKDINLKDEVIGTRTSTFERDGVKYSDTTTFNPDYTGVSVTTRVDTKEKTTYPFTWCRTGLYTYVLTYENSRWTATYNRGVHTISYKEINYADDQVIGTHTMKETSNGVVYTAETTFYPDGTGIYTIGSGDGQTGSSDFVWEKEDSNTYTLYYHTPLYSHAETVTYNSKDKTFTQIARKYRWVENYRLDGKHLLDINVIDGDSTKVNVYDADGNITEKETTWETLGEGTYRVTYSDNEIWTVTYNPFSGSFDWTK